MPITMCISSDDEHGDYPHRLVIVIMTLTKTVEKETTTKTTMGPVYVICAHCDHWVERAVPTCHCRNECHQQASLARAEGRRKRYRSVTSA